MQLIMLCCVKLNFVIASRESHHAIGSQTFVLLLYTDSIFKLGKKKKVSKIYVLFFFSSFDIFITYYLDIFFYIFMMRKEMDHQSKCFQGDAKST